MDTPLPVSSVPVSAPILAPEPPRAPATGTIRIPGMDQPAPVSTSAPVAKFDFGKLPSAQPIKPPTAPMYTAKVAASPAPMPSSAGPSRIPSQLQPVSENRSFGEGPAPVVMRPTSAAPAASQDNGFNFDFGFGQQPGQQKPANDPIADLIAAELSAPPEPDREPTPLEETREAKSIETFVPVMKTTVTPAQTSTKPTISPMSATPRSASSAPIPLKPVSVTPRPMENDRFAISPGMGLNGRPAATQPLGTPVLRQEPQEPDYDDSDPMAEIESLIGEAVRVELGPGPVRVQSPVEVRPEVHGEQAPIVPPLTAQFAPRRTALVEHDDDGGEHAILAAAHDTGADLGRLDGPMAEESPYRRLKVKPQRNSGMSGGMRQYVGMAVAGTLLLAAGLGLYWVLNMGRGTTPIEAPVLTADSTPVKVAPTPEITPSAEATASPVMEQLNGTSTEPSTEQLVTTDETSGQDPLRVVGDTPSTTTAGEDPDSESGLANRKVRTVTVRPDGTIVPGDDAVAGAEELPVDRPNVPEVPGSTDETTDLLGDGAFPSSDPIGAAIDTATATPVTTAPTVTDADTLVGQISAAGGFLDNTKVPPTPAHQPDYAALAYVAPVETPTPLAAIPENSGPTDLLETTPEPVAAASVSVSSASAYVQLTSSPSQADANAQMRSQTNRYGSLFEGGKLIVQSADLGQKGTWYRVRLPVSSLSEANRICASIKAAGGDCIATGG